LADAIKRGVSWKQAGVYALLAGVVVAIVAAFSNRAVYIDEHLFLNVARMPRDWGFLASGEWLSFGIFYPLAAHTHSPFGEYCLALLFATFGAFNEPAFRLTFGAFFSIVAALSFYGLARRVAVHPLLLTLLFIASPAFFVLSPTLMMDMPMVALLLAGLHWYLRGIEENSRLRLSAAALCFTCSVAFGYAAQVLLVCLFVIAARAKRPRREILAIAMPFWGLSVWAIALFFHYGELPLIRTAQHFARAGSIAQNILATPSFLGGVSVFPWLLSLLSFRESRRTNFRIAAASVLTALLLSCFIGWITYRYGIWYIFLASAGVALILLFARQFPALFRTRDVFERFVAVGFPAVVLFYVVVGEFISARYLLLALPWLFLALFRKTERMQLATLVAATLILSVAVAIADYRFVAAYRDWVTANLQSIQPEGFSVWNSGESGLRFYLEERGIPSLSHDDSRPKGGELVVRQRMFRYSLPSSIETMLVTLKTWELTDGFPLRTFNQEAQAGFHGSGFGVVPFAVSRRPYDVLQIEQITPLAQTSPAAVWSPDGPVLTQDTPDLLVPTKLPPRTRVEYELEGQGSVEIRDGFVVLRKNQTDSINWRNFRIVPESLAKTP
jgi:hypothetical protein